MDAKERLSWGGGIAILLALAGAVALGIWGKEGALAAYTTIATVAVPTFGLICGAHTWGQTRTDQTAPAAPAQGGATQ